MKRRSLIGCLILLPFAIVGLILAYWIFGQIFAFWEDARDSPEKELFLKENDKIDFGTDQIALGNSKQAIAVADEFSQSLEAVSDAFSTGTNGQAPPPAPHFVTYCRIAPAGVVILCRVPDSRIYSRRVQTMFETTAWTLAQGAAKKGNVDQSLPLVVGLRCGGAYGTVLIGKMNGNPEAQGDDVLDSRRRLYPYFIGSTPGD
jgi:hypothetical protein